MERIYVGNLPYVAQREDVEALFRENEIPITNLDMSIDPFTGRNPSYCFVDLLCIDATRAMDILPGQDVRGRAIKVNLHTEKRRQKFGLSMRTFDRGCTSNDAAKSQASNGKSVFDKWSRQDAEDHWTAPCDEGRRLWVGGLPRIRGERAINAEMRNLFRGFGLEAVSKIIPTQPRPDLTFIPRDNYYCFVDLASAQNARDAVDALDGQPTPHGGRYKVRISRPNHNYKVVREQLGGVWPGENTESPKLSPRRNLEGNWRLPAQESPSIR